MNTDEHRYDQVVYVDSHWRWLTARSGANLLQSAGTGLRPLAAIPKKLGTPPGSPF
ncbi:hypothetical protein [Candidatus Thiodictyon syntrophicum]|jgi:hypothetical protein|uniref:hypothetical protein n=1 Tax=Candidatus Thiodictyon syntrophicum TaxID=1166950 RepID=UPI0015625B83|nr:hypothetical protein [Candidatus Thiodictyon syntrophicum]